MQTAEMETRKREEQMSCQGRQIGGFIDKEDRWQDVTSRKTGGFID